MVNIWAFLINRKWAENEQKNVKKLFSTVNKEISKIHQWLISNKFSLDTGKTKFSLFQKPSQTDKVRLTLPTLKISDNVIEREQSIKFLDALLNECFLWNKRIIYIEKKVS